MTQSADGVLWRTYLKVNPVAHTLFVMPYVGPDVTYKWEMPDANHLVLTSMPDPAAQGSKNVRAFTPAVIALTRIPIPNQYPLFSTPFRFTAYF